MKYVFQVELDVTSFVDDRDFEGMQAQMEDELKSTTERVAQRFLTKTSGTNAQYKGYTL